MIQQLWNNSEKCWWVTFSLQWHCVQRYKGQFTGRQSNGKMLQHLFCDMEDWCASNCQSKWFHDGILSFVFWSRDDAIRFRLTFI